MSCKHLGEIHKKTSIYIIIIIILIFVDVIVMVFSCKAQRKETNKENNTVVDEQIITLKTNEVKESSKELLKQKNEIVLGWELTLANPENKIPDNYNFELENIDKYRKFDSRAIKYLNEMLNAMKSEGITDVWVQSAYRSIEYQTNLFNNKTNEYMKMGYTKEEAEAMTEKTINRPGHSDHNVGLAVDFNYVSTDFENSKAYAWLIQNAKDYGFILRYPKDKEDITKIKYEPWHWRYVGKENAQIMEDKGMCLEEYIEYLKQ